MANSRLFIKSASIILNNYGSTRVCSFRLLKKGYSVFPPTYIKPTFRKDEQEVVFSDPESKKIVHQPMKPALASDTCSEFYDPRVLKFICTIMRDGNKKLAIMLVTKAFEGVKRIQLERYHKAKTNEEKDSIELDPFVVFHRAVDNCIPILHLIPCRKGGITYQIPVPISPALAQHNAMKWLIEAAKEKDDEQRFYNTLARELVAASQNQGRAVKWKQELYKKCQANRAYAHFRWL